MSTDLRLVAFAAVAGLVVVAVLVAVFFGTLVVFFIATSSALMISEISVSRF